MPADAANTRDQPAMLRPVGDAPSPIAARLHDCSGFDRLAVVSMPRSGTSTYRTLFAELFGLRPVHAACETDPNVWPKPPRWQPYENDGSIPRLARGEIVCLHGPPSDHWRAELRESPTTLVVHTYRDARDAALSATRFIRHRPNHLCGPTFARLAFEDALACCLVGCDVPFDDQPAHLQARNPERLPARFGGYRELAQWSERWLAEPYAAHLRYEDLFHSDATASNLAAALARAGVTIHETAAERALDRVSFERLTGRAMGEPKAGEHLERGLARSWFSEPLSLSTRALSQAVFVAWLERLGYPADERAPGIDAPPP
ncbi:MAG: hypothetical protein EA378_08295 [Phycisphaerales bacterium]|nr:MAG: hypothetical protein EA378_08295 [Phycisphaerales bacterium]